MTDQKAGGPDWRAVLDRTLTEYRALTRATAARLSSADQARHERAHRQEEQDHDNDVVESWMADPRGGQEQEDSGPDVLDRLDRGELTWDDVLSGRADDRESASLRAFLAERAAELRAAREARR